MSKNLQRYLVDEINHMFTRNGMEGNMIHRFFQDCVEDGTLHQFYIDDRVSFKGKRKLYQLIEELQKVMKEESN